MIGQEGGRVGWVLGLLAATVGFLSYHADGKWERLGLVPIRLR